MKKRLLIMTQRVDGDDQLLGFFITWLRCFAEHFEHVTVLCQSEGRYSLPSNVVVLSLGKSSGSGRVGQTLRFWKFLWGERRRYDSVLIHMNPIWAVVAAPVLRVLRKPLFLWYTHKAVTMRLRLAELFVRSIFTASRESFRLASKKVIVTGHGIDVDIFRPREAPHPLSTSLRILSVGRIARVKDYDTLIEAAQILRSEHVDFSITVIGEPALAQDRIYEEHLKQRIHELQLQECFHFIGKVVNSDLPGYYQSHQVFVHMSQTGSLDKVMLEALACGDIVLSSNDAARSILPEEWIFSSRDSRDLALKIRTSRATAFDGPRYVQREHDVKRLIHKLSALL